MSLEKELVKIYKRIEDEKRLGDKRAEQFYNAMFSGNATPIFAGVGIGTVAPDFALDVGHAAFKTIGTYSIRARHIDGKADVTTVLDTLHLQYSAVGKGVWIGDSGTDHPLIVYGSITGSTIHISSIKSGATQAAAGAAANEIWKTNGHDTLPDNVLMIGV